MDNNFYRNSEAIQRRIFSNLFEQTNKEKQEMIFYQVTTQYLADNDKGKTQRVTERYLVNAVSVTDAEKVVTDKWGMNVSDFEVKEVKKSRIIDVLV